MKTLGLKTLAAALIFIGVTSCNENKKEQKEVMQEETTEETIPVADNSQVSLDWNGNYNGILPCADCAGIQTELVLNNDNTYEFYQKSLGKDETVKTSKGNLKWEDGTYIILEGVENSPKFAVQEGQLVMVDAQNNSLDATDNGAYLLIQNNLRGRDLTGNYWKLVELNGKEISDKDYQNEPYIIMYSDGSKVFGNSGCNTFRGSFMMEEGNKLSFSEMASTRMACANDKVENQFLEVLKKADNYTISGNTLSFNKAKMAPLAKFKASLLSE